MENPPARPPRPLLIALAVGLVLLSVVASSLDAGDAERAVFRAAQGLPAAWGMVLVAVMPVGTLVAGPVAAVLAIAVRRRQLAIELLCAGGSAWLASRALKLLVTRPRPAALLGDVVLRGAPAEGFGFPSGHVTVAAGLAAVAGAWLPRPLVLAAWVVVGLVSVGRMYIGAHLPLDVLGGLLLGGLLGVGLRTLFSAAHFQRALADPDA